MTKPGFTAHPYLLGFDQVEEMAERARSANDGYPPYNIEQAGPNAFRISLAVAGFSEADLGVTLEDRQLVIRGRQSEVGAEARVFLHRGIAARQFTRSFVLAEGVEVAGALLENGLLHVDLRRQRPESIVQTVVIRKA